MLPPPPTPPATSQSRRAGAKKPTAKSKKIAKGLVALSSAAIVSVYGVGYVRTDAAVTTDAPTAVVVAAVAPTVSGVPLVPTVTASVFAALPPATSTIPAPVEAPAPTTRPALASPTLAPAAQPVLVSPSPAPTATATVSAAPAAPAVAQTRVPNTIAPLFPTAAPATTIPATVAPPTENSTAARYKDGTYVGTGSSRHGSITATVIVRGGAITSAAITQCGTRYPCAKIAALPGEVVASQSGDVDAVSGATDSSVAYQGAVANALAKAMAG